MQNEKKIVKIKFSDNVGKCPFCNKDAYFYTKTDGGFSTDFCKKVCPESLKLPVEYYQLGTCIHCEKTILFHYGINDYSINGPAELLSYYPLRADSTEYLPDEIKNNFPKFIQIFEQVLRAHHNGLHFLTGAGMRRAADCLVDEYLIKFQNETITKKDSFSEKVDKLKGINQNCINLVRKFGNKEAHNDENQFSYEEAKEALDIFCREIQMTCIKIEIDKKMKGKI